MSVQRTTVGDCPRCGAAISHHRVLIEYETASGRSRYADCPDCREVVHPN